MYLLLKEDDLQMLGKMHFGLERPEFHECTLL